MKNIPENDPFTKAKTTKKEALLLDKKKTRLNEKMRSTEERKLKKDSEDENL